MFGVVVYPDNNHNHNHNSKHHQHHAYRAANHQLAGAVTARRAILPPDTAVAGLFEIDDTRARCEVTAWLCTSKVGLSGEALVPVRSLCWGLGGVVWVLCGSGVGKGIEGIFVVLGLTACAAASVLNTFHCEG